MKELEIEKMTEIQGSGFFGGLACGLGLGAGIVSGGLVLVAAVAGCLAMAE